MIVSRGIFFFIFIVISSILVAGCISPSSAPGIPAGNMTVSTTPVAPLSEIPLITTLAPVQLSEDCNRTFPSDNGEPFILINPISHYYIGDTISVDGVTSLPAGEKISLVIIEAIYHSCPKSQIADDNSVRYCHSGLRDTVVVRSGKCGINTWSWEVNTSQHDFVKDQGYFISASGEGDRFVENSSLFFTSGIPKSNITLNLPENDPNEYAIRFSGQVNTGNGPDEKLLLTISSDSGKQVSYTIPVSHDETGYYWNYSLKKSDIVPYNFLTVNVSSATSPEISIERTFLYNNEPVYYPYDPYGP